MIQYGQKLVPDEIFIEHETRLWNIIISCTGKPNSANFSQQRLVKIVDIDFSHHQ